MLVMFVEDVWAAISLSPMAILFSTSITLTEISVPPLQMELWFNADTFTPVECREHVGHMKERLFDLFADRSGDIDRLHYTTMVCRLVDACRDGSPDPSCLVMFIASSQQVQ